MTNTNAYSTLTAHSTNANYIVHLFQMWEKMKELEVLDETGLFDSDVDPCDKVMGSSTHSRVPLYRRGVSMENLKDKGLGEKRDRQAVVVPEEYVDAIRCNLTTEV